ncbi:MAG: hypothetical protein JSS83_13095 [Cyanobacteria bacterium SZAS LIN-3]|nr:hypothetical protein [Cyanobacteria bacterium SZAS LIN-3]
MDAILKLMAANPPSITYIMCMAAALTGLISTIGYVVRTRRIINLLSGPIPKMSDRDEVTKFQEQRKALQDSADSCGILGVGASFVCILLLFLLYDSFKGDQSIYFLVAALLQAATILEFVFNCIRNDNRIENILETRTELSCLKYLERLVARRRKTEGKARSKDQLFWGSLDDFACDFFIPDKEAQKRIAAPVDFEAARSLSDALWRAGHQERPVVNEPVLLIWRDGRDKNVKMVVSKVLSVEDVPAESLVTSTGTAIIEAAQEKFCGGKVAYFCGTPSPKIERGWLATADRAHVLLSSLRWLDEDQRQFCYQLINPGKPYPADFN